MNQNVLNRTSTATIVREMLKRKPYVRYALEQNIANMSAVARLIQKDIKDTNIEAVKAALIRETNKLSYKRKMRDEVVIDILKNSKILIQDKISVVTSERKVDLPYLVMAKLSDSFVYIVDQTKIPRIKKEGLVLSRDLNAVFISSVDDIGEIPGFIAFLTNILASEDINIKEFISCYTDTVIILTQEDAIKAFTILKRYG